MFSDGDIFSLAFRSRLFSRCYEYLFRRWLGLALVCMVVSLVFFRALLSRRGSFAMSVISDRGLSFFIQILDPLSLLRVYSRCVHTCPHRHISFSLLEFGRFDDPTEVPPFESFR